MEFKHEIFFRALEVTEKEYRYHDEFKERVWKAYKVLYELQPYIKDKIEEEIGKIRRGESIA